MYIHALAKIIPCIISIPSTLCKTILIWPPWVFIEPANSKYLKHQKEFFSSNICHNLSEMESVKSSLPSYTLACLPFIFLKGPGAFHYWITAFIF